MARNKKGENGSLAEEETRDDNSSKKTERKIPWKWIVGAILIVIIIVFVVLFAKSASTVAKSAADATGSGISSVINTVTSAADTGIDAAGIAGGLYIANWAIGDYVKEILTDGYTALYNVIYGTESASTAVADASAAAVGEVGTAAKTSVSNAVDSGVIGGGENVDAAEDAKDAVTAAVDVAELAV